MAPAKIYLNIIFNISAIILITKILILDNPDLDKLSFILRYEILFIFIFFMLLKLLITLLFYFILNTIADKKFDYLHTSGVYLQGGVINQLLPGLGFIFRFYKFKDESKVNLAEFSISQTMWSISAFSSYLLIGSILGLIIFLINIYNFIFLLLFFIFIALITYSLRKNIFYLISNILKKFSNLIYDLKKIKNILKIKFYIFFLIFLGFILLTCLESFGFFLLLIIFGADISLIEASSIWVGSTLMQIITMVNFFGLFELILTTASSLLLSSFKEMFIFALGFRIINTSSTISVIILIYLSKLIKRKFK